VHFYGGARGHGYARTLFPGGRILVFDEGSVYGYRDASLGEELTGIFRVSKNPEFIDLSEKIRRARRTRRKPRGGKADFIEGKELARQLSKFVWKDGIPQDPAAMNLGRSGLGDAVRKVTKYEYRWHRDVALYPNAMLLTDKAFWLAGPARFDEEATRRHLGTTRTDRFELAPFVQDAVDTMEGKKGGRLLAVDKSQGTTLADCPLPSSPVFDGMIAAHGKLLVALKDGSVVCLAGQASPVQAGH
jgi:hypothetical protein